MVAYSVMPVHELLTIKCAVPAKTTASLLQQREGGEAKATDPDWCASASATASDHKYPPMPASAENSLK